MDSNRATYWTLIGALKERHDVLFDACHIHPPKDPLYCSYSEVHIDGPGPVLGEHVARDRFEGPWEPKTVSD